MITLATMNRMRLSAFKTALKNHGVLASLAVLNDGVSHRYTGLYHLRGEFLVCLFMLDKQLELRTDDLRPVPLTVSFCQFTLREGAFATSNSALDARLDGHPFQGIVQAYHAVPVQNAAGELVGTLCHFDWVERDLPDEELELMHEAVRILPAHVSPLA